MFEQLLNLVKEQAGTAIINNPDIPNERNDEAVGDVTNSLQVVCRMHWLADSLRMC